MATVEPLRFHGTRMHNIRVTSDGTVARRVNTNFFTRGLVFGTRPVQIDEKITFKLMEVVENLGGFVYVGFTSRDPETLRGVTCQALAKASGFWSWFFPKELTNESRNLFYYVSGEGAVHYGAEQVEKGRFQDVVKLNQPLWPLFDIFGNSSAIRLIHAPPPPRLSTNRKLVPLMLHPTHSRNVRLDANVFRRTNSHYTHGYVFSDQPIRCDETVTLRVAPDRSGRFVGLVHLGVTSCDPSHLEEELPDNVHRLVDRPEYWVPVCDFSKLDCGDEIGLAMTETGQIRFDVNGGKFKGVVHVDASLKLWLFVNVYGTSQDIHLFVGAEQTKVEEKECVVCYDNAIETALYRCGHTCMCFECAVEQWQGKGDGHCPLCRAVIKDVIRINK